MFCCCFFKDTCVLYKLKQKTVEQSFFLLFFLLKPIGKHIMYIHFDGHS